MAITSEIEKLERRWNENPSGLMFAPLAEAYRKAGNHAHALELLEHGLRVHPDYVPALIVRGRCHLETGGEEAAEAAFNQALTRDPVNGIALRGLAEVYERTGRIHEAVERLELLLEVDRGDSDARGALERLRLQAAPTPSQQPAEVVAQEPVEAVSASGEEAPANESGIEALMVEPEVPLDLMLEAPVVPVAGLGVENLSIDPMATESAEPPAAAGRLPWEPVAEAKSLWGEIEITSVRVPDAVEAEPVLPEAIAPESYAAEPVAPEAIASEPVASEPEPVDAVPELEAPLPPAAWSPSPGPVLWTPAVLPDLAPESPEATPPSLLETELELAEPAPASEPPAMEIAESDAEPVPPESPEAAAVPWPAIEASTAPEDVAEEPESEPEPAQVAAEASVPAPGAEASPPAADEPSAAAEEPELIVTESMAEVFLRQGHKSLALAVYRQLAERSAGSASIEAAIAQLEAELAQPTPAPEPVRVAYRATETGGRSVGQFLRAVLSAPPPVAASTVLPPAIEPAGEPTRPTPQALTLGAVFGDEPAQAPAVAEAPATTEPSYDEFFGATPAAEVGAGGVARNPEAEDLRQFNDWLRGLKR